MPIGTLGGGKSGPNMAPSISRFGYLAEIPSLDREGHSA